MKNIIRNIRHNWKSSLLGGGSLSAAIYYYSTTPNPDKEKLAGMIVVALLALISADGKPPVK